MTSPFFLAAVTLDVPDFIAPRPRSVATAVGAIRRHLPGPSRPHFRPLVSYGSVPARIGHNEGAAAADMFLVKAAMEGPGGTAGRAAMEGPGVAAGRAAAVPLVDVKLNVVSIRVRAKNRNRSWNFRTLNSPFYFRRCGEGRGRYMASVLLELG